MDNTVTQIPHPHHPSLRYSRGERIGLICLGVALFALLFLAAMLTPNPSGLGTHMQLGLPGCTMYTFSGIRCPGCGMTTSWAHTMNGDFSSGIRANVGGVLLCLLSVAVFPCLLWMGIRGRSLPFHGFGQVAIAVLLIAMSISIVEWLIRLAF
jgi:hypothetical protein